MSALNLEKFRKLNVARCEQCFHSVKAWTPQQWSVALMGEVGEVCGAVKKIWRGDGTQLALAHELADVFTYADLLAERVNVQPDGLQASGYLPDSLNALLLPNTYSSCDMLAGLVELGHALMVRKSEFSWEYERPLSEFMLQLRAFAQQHKVWLASAVVKKFNIVSDRVGFAPRAELGG